MSSRPPTTTCPSTDPRERREQPQPDRASARVDGTWQVHRFLAGLIRVELERRPTVTIGVKRYMPSSRGSETVGSPVRIVATVMSGKTTSMYPPSMRYAADRSLNVTSR